MRTASDRVRRTPRWIAARVRHRAAVSLHCPSVSDKSTSKRRPAGRQSCAVFAVERREADSGRCAPRLLVAVGDERYTFCGPVANDMRATLAPRDGVLSRSERRQSRPLVVTRLHRVTCGNDAHRTESWGAIERALQSGRPCAGWIPNHTSMGEERRSDTQLDR